MSLRAEVETFRGQISNAWEKSADNLANKWPRESELPDGLYDERQLKRWQTARYLIESTVLSFLVEMGIEDFSVEKDFSDHLKHPFSKEVEFTIKFREGEKRDKRGWQEDKEYREVSFVYDPGGRFTQEGLTARYAVLASPKNKKMGGGVSADEAVQWIGNPEATDISCAHLTASVDEEPLTNLLKLIFANPQSKPSKQELVS